MKEITKMLRDAAVGLLKQHSLLMRSDNHDGANYCPCELAVKYRQADAVYWSERNKEAKERRDKAALKKALRPMTEVGKKFIF